MPDNETMIEKQERMEGNHNTELRKLWKKKVTGNKKKGKDLCGLIQIHNTTD